MDKTLNLKILFLIGYGKAGKQINTLFESKGFKVFCFSRSGEYKIDLSNLANTKSTILSFIETNNIRPDIIIFNSRNSLKNSPQLSNINLDNLVTSLHVGALSLITILQTITSTISNLESNYQCQVLIASGSFAKAPNINQFNLSLTKILLSSITNLLPKLDLDCFCYKELIIDGKIGIAKTEIHPQTIAQNFYNLYQDKESYYLTKPLN